ncbi:GNAT family N-acetyltransferase [Vibrio sp. SCSIO 43137]|uniref:GNAT family N-acetyltransferase n=1 Tax=Vibrio sp. SCSIO 43137 TaxID=3021011 RepID=UPI002307F41B|nr:N-acetyltransferase [Vibrio sp. SCSIO 43137]WCE30928.1 N-acetyltransferase [Vibrio sp. SCSIO 43137]
MIREAKPTDCVDLAALSIQVWLHTYATDGVREKISRYVLNNFTEQQFLNFLNRPEIKVLVYIKDEHLVGFVTVDLTSEYESEGNGYEISTLYVSEHFHGMGIGRQLLCKVQAQFGLPFWLSTWEGNVNAIGFYHKLGFKMIGEVNFDLDGEFYNNHVLQLSKSL